MVKVDFKKEMKALYNPPVGKFEIIEVPPLTYFMVNGTGDPNKAAAYKEAVEALYAVSYTLKLMAKKESSRDYIVPPLEGLWWADDMATFISREKDKWSWTMMIMVPDFIDKATATRAALAAAKKKDLPALSKVRFEALEEGTVVQTMHIGSYDDEGPVLRKLHAEFLPANGLKERGKHHEIYLGDLPRLVLAQRGLAFGELVDGSDIDPVLLHGCLCWPVWPGSIHRRRGRRGPRGPRQRSRQDSKALDSARPRMARSERRRGGVLLGHEMATPLTITLARTQPAAYREQFNRMSWPRQDAYVRSLDLDGLRAHGEAMGAGRRLSVDRGLQRAYRRERAGHRKYDDYGGRSADRYAALYGTGAGSVSF